MPLDPNILDRIDTPVRNGFDDEGNTANALAEHRFAAEHKGSADPRIFVPHIDGKRLTGMRALLILLCAGAAGTATWAQLARPPSGIDVDEVRSVALADAPSRDCLLLAMRGADILLARPALEALAAAAPARWATEAERLALIDSRRAQALLAAPSAPSTGAQPCRIHTRPVDAEAQWLVLSLIERGAASVRDAGTGLPVPTVQIRYFGQRCGPLCGRGFIGVSLPGQTRPFLLSDWWVS